MSDFYCGGNIVEDMGSYKPGGYHPVHLGDTFSTCPGSDRPRYRVLQKLGHGYFSTVWLAQDMGDNDRAVALKITRAEVDLAHESCILQTLSSPSPGTSHPGKKHVLQLLDYFQIHGPNGSHYALVTDILVPRQYLRDLRIFDAKRTSYELLLALAYLKQCRVIHGDLHTDNIAFIFTGLSRFKAELWMTTLDDPSVIPVIPRQFDDQSDCLPKYLVEAAELTSIVKLCIERYGIEGMYSVIIDFGSAFRGSDPIPEPRTPAYISAPEIILQTTELGDGFYKSDWRFHSDIWSLGCSIYEMVAGHRLFTEPRDYLLEEIIKLAGPLPQSWLELLEQKPKSHIENDESSLRDAAKIYQEKLFKGEIGYASALQSEPGFPPLLRSMLKIDPVTRDPPELLLQSAWFGGIHYEN